METETRDVDRLLQMLKWVAGGVIAWWLALPALVQALALMQVLDVVSGFVLAGRAGDIQSRRFGEGWRRKAMAWLLVLGVYVVERHLTGDFPPVFLGMTVADVTVTGFVFMEALSLVENAQRAGLPVPKFLVTMFAEGRRRFADVDVDVEKAEKPGKDGER